MVHSKTLKDYQEAVDSFREDANNDELGERQQQECSIAALTTSTRIIRLNLQIAELESEDLIADLIDKITDKHKDMLANLPD